MMKKIILILMAFIAMELHAQVAVIANKSATISSVSSNSALDIFSLGKREFKVFYLKSSPANDKFFAFIGKDFSEMKKVWMKAQLTEGKTAIGLNSEEEILQKVASTPGGIGYLSKSKADGSVKIVQTIQ